MEYGEFDLENCGETVFKCECVINVTTVGAEDKTSDLRLNSRRVAFNSH